MDKPWLKFYDPGVPEEISIPEGMLLHHVVDSSAARFPNRPASLLPTLAGGTLSEGRLSYRDLLHAANRFANGLIAMGVQKGDRVALLLPNSPQFLIGYLGALKMGAVVVALDPLHEPSELEAQLIDCGAETVITMTKSYPVVKQIQPNTQVTRVITTNIKEYYHPLVRSLFTIAREKQEGFRVPLDRRDYSFRLILQHSPDTNPAVSISPDDVALLYYSSAQPRALMLTHRNMVANCLQTLAWRTDAEPGHEAVLGVCPFVSLYGMQLAMLNTLFLGGALILFPRLELELVLLALDKYRPTVIPGNQALYQALVDTASVHKHNLHSARVYFSQANLLSAEVREMFESVSGGRVTDVYGASATGVLALAEPIRGACKEGSIGLPLPGTSARIVDSAFPMRVLAAGETGELAIQGPQTPKGYWNKPRETAGLNRDGWMMTGTRAQMDEDGFFYLVQ